MTDRPSGRIALFLATGMYVGYSPVAPGTLGSFLGVIICSFLSSVSSTLYGIILFFSFLTATLAASIAQEFFSKKDPSQIVCDEIIGYMVALFLIPFTLFNIIIVFLLFRFFDIVKPFPIKTIERKIEGGLGIVLDDVLAGIYSNIAFQLLKSIFL